MLGHLAVLTIYRQVEAVRLAARTGPVDAALSDLLALVDTLADDRGGNVRRRPTRPSASQADQPGRRPAPRKASGT
jgi:hypothetical protein